MVASVALYGSVAMVREYCGACRRKALVIDGQLACCDTPAVAAPSAIERMTLSDGKRRKPSTSAQREILAAQDGCCLYCERPFGTKNVRGARSVKLRIEWDHQIPFAYSWSSSDEQFAAACQVCNGIKSDRMYQTLDEARVDLQLRREQKGWSL